MRIIYETSDGGVAVIIPTDTVEELKEASI